MTRGRSKDFTIPTSRALTQQRDYRARKAKYVADLEERCRRAEVENAKLRRELQLARAGLPVQQAVVSSETAQATLELMRHLNVASASLARFQQLAFNNNQPSSSPAATQSHPSILPSPATSSPFSSTTNSFFPNYDETNPQTECFPKPNDTSSKTDAIDHARQNPSARPIEEEECCGGLIDCRGLVDVPEEDREDISFNPLVKNSNMRSTSDGFPIL